MCGSGLANESRKSQLGGSIWGRAWMDLEAANGIYRDLADTENESPKTNRKRTLWCWLRVNGKHNKKLSP